MIRSTMLFTTALSGLALVACSTSTHRVVLHPAKLALGRTDAVVRCDYWLRSITDERSSGDIAGGLGRHRFTMEDPLPIIRQHLQQAGVGDQEGAGATPVSVQLMRMYLGQNLGSKIPVVVFKIDVGATGPQVVRSQEPSLNWNGTVNEAYAAYSRALRDASGKVVNLLNDRCG